MSGDPSRAETQAIHEQRLLVFGYPRAMMLTHTHGLHGASSAAEIGAWILHGLLLTALLL